MLARSYTVLGRFAEALPAYPRAPRAAARQRRRCSPTTPTRVAATKRTAQQPAVDRLIERALNDRPEAPEGAGARRHRRLRPRRLRRRDRALAEDRSTSVPPDSELAPAGRRRASPTRAASSAATAPRRRRLRRRATGDRRRRRDRERATPAARHRRQRHGHARSALAAQAGAGRHGVRLRAAPPAAAACRSRCSAPEVAGPAASLQARRQHGDGARHDAVERAAGDRSARASARRGTAIAERRRPLRARRTGVAPGAANVAVRIDRQSSPTP